MINEEILIEIAQIFAERKANCESNPWEYDARLFLDKYGVDARLAAWNLYCASESALSHWRTELDAMLKNPGEAKSDARQDLARTLVFVVEDLEACVKTSREVLVNELF